MDIFYDKSLMISPHSQSFLTNLFKLVRAFKLRQHFGLSISVNDT